jgi:hypothetical protein
MKIIKILLCYFSLMLSSAYAQTINSEFKFAQDISKGKEGDVVEATIKIWPLENADLSQFKKLEKTLLFNSLYFSQINSLDVSPNNADVVEIKGTFIITSAAIDPASSIKYNDSVIELKSGNIQIEKSKDESKDFYILDQSLSGSKMWILVTVFVFILLLVLVLKSKMIQSFILNLRPDNRKQAIKKYDERFRVANSREDFELLYLEKERWLSLLESIAPAHRDFLKTLNQHQFKRDWGNEEFTEVRSSFDVIRRSFEK